MSRIVERIGEWQHIGRAAVVEHNARPIGVGCVGGIATYPLAAQPGARIGGRLDLPLSDGVVGEQAINGTVLAQPVIEPHLTGIRSAMDEMVVEIKTP